MNEAIQAQLTALRDEVGAAAVPDECKRTLHWCIGRLPILYVNYRQTNESRYGEEITRLVQGMLKDLSQRKKGCPEAQALSASIRERLRQLHEDFGLPGLELKLPVTAAARPRKVS